MTGLTLGLGLSLASRAGGGVVVPGLARPTFSTTPDVLYHPNTETGVALSGNEITGVTGNEHDLTTIGTPLELTDANGCKRWVLDPTAKLTMGTDFAYHPREILVLMVVRQHISAPNITYFGQTYQNDGTTLDTTFAPLFQTYGTGTPGVLASQITNALTAAWIKNHSIGSQLQVIGIRMRAGTGASADTGNRIITNGNAMNIAQHYLANPMKGAKFGGYKTTGTAGFDLYCAAIWHGIFSDAEADALAAEMQDHFGIVDTTRDLILMGDSITAAYNIQPRQTQCAILGEGGAGLIPADVRIINQSASGNKVSNLVTYRDAANGILNLPGGTSANHKVVIHIGVNDMTTDSPATVVSNLQALIDTTSTGLLQRGFDVVVCVNIQSSANATLTTNLNTLRGLLRDSSFLTAMDAGSGGANEGRVTLLELPLIEYEGGTPFDDTPVNEGTTDLFVDGVTHPTEEGRRVICTGGDTPEYGYGSVCGVVPANALTLNGQPLTLNGAYLTLN